MEEPAKQPEKEQIERLGGNQASVGLEVIHCVKC